MLFIQHTGHYNQINNSYYKVLTSLPTAEGGMDGEADSEAR